MNYKKEKWEIESLEELIRDNQIKIFNGTRHDLPFFDFSGRHDNASQCFDSDKEIRTYSVDRPLDVIYRREVLCSNSNPRLDMLDDSEYLAYDSIVVSHHYAKRIIEMCKSTSVNHFPEEYLDRLFILDKVRKGKKIVGFKGLIKVFPPKNPNYYISKIFSGQQVSILSSICCIHQFEFDLHMRNVTDYLEEVSGYCTPDVDDLFQLKLAIAGYINLRPHLAC